MLEIKSNVISGVDVAKVDQYFDDEQYEDNNVQVMVCNVNLWSIVKLVFIWFTSGEKSNNITQKNAKKNK